MARKGSVGRGPDIYVEFTADEYAAFRSLSSAEKGQFLRERANEAIPVGDPQILWAGYAGVETRGEDLVVVKGWGRTTWGKSR